MDTAVILAAGLGGKLWPYSTIRSKAMIPVAGKALISYNVETLLEAGYKRIVIAANLFPGQIKSVFRQDKRIEVVETGRTAGTAETLLFLKDRIAGRSFVLLYGDTIIEKSTLKKFLDFAEKQVPSVLAPVLPEGGDTRDHICLRAEGGLLKEVMGHPRGGYNMGFGAFCLPDDIYPWLESNPGYFTSTQVGMMSPAESFLEVTVGEYSRVRDVAVFPCQAAEISDVDRPWDILRVNNKMAKSSCAALTENHLGEGASIDSSVIVNGFVKLGHNSVIRKGVIISGNCIIGDNTAIENGALLMGDNVIGSDCRISNYCFLEKGAVVGDSCVLNHCAEFSGVLFNNVYLYHYMELYGIIGENTDIGAATVCGTLRFDDGATAHRVKGRKEIPGAYSNATYIGDFCRTGVNVIFAPGKKVGCYSIIGAGTIVDRDLPDRTLVYPKQELVFGEWGPEKYGW